MHLNDADLTGFIDSELTPEQMAQVRDALASDPQAAARLEVLRAAMDGWQSDADALLKMAPPMPPLPAQAVAPKTHFGMIGAAIAACAVGAAVWFNQPTDRDWMAEVASYQALYVTETLAELAPQSPDVLASISDRIGRDLSTATALNGLTYRRAQLLGIDGTDLVQMAYLDANGAPFALCLIQSPDGAALDVQLREGLASASWADGSHAYLLIGGADLSVVETLAQSLQTAL